jgi:hypothetical protein
LNIILESLKYGENETDFTLRHNITSCEKSASRNDSLKSFPTLGVSFRAREKSVLVISDLAKHRKWTRFNDRDICEGSAEPTNFVK